MANPVINSFFPSQVASDQEKMSQDYGLRVGTRYSRRMV